MLMQISVCTMSTSTNVLMVSLLVCIETFDTNKRQNGLILPALISLKRLSGHSLKRLTRRRRPQLPKRPARMFRSVLEPTAARCQGHLMRWVART